MLVPVDACTPHISIHHHLLAPRTVVHLLPPYAGFLCTIVGHNNTTSTILKQNISTHLAETRPRSERSRDMDRWELLPAGWSAVMSRPAPGSAPKQRIWNTCLFFFNCIPCNPPASTPTLTTWTNRGVHGFRALVEGQGQLTQGILSVLLFAILHADTLKFLTLSVAVAGTGGPKVVSTSQRILSKCHPMPYQTGHGGEKVNARKTSKETEREAKSDRDSPYSMRRTQATIQYIVRMCEPGSRPGRGEGCEGLHLSVPVALCNEDAAKKLGAVARA